MTPIRDLVLVKPFMADEVTEGGLYIPENYRERSCKAQVVKVGNGTAKVKMEAKVGDVVFHIKGAGEPFVIDGEYYYLIRQNDILSYSNN